MEEELTTTWSPPRLQVATVLSRRKRMAMILPANSALACWICIPLTLSFFLRCLLFSATDFVLLRYMSNGHIIASIEGSLALQWMSSPRECSFYAKLEFIFRTCGKLLHLPQTFTCTALRHCVFNFFHFFSYDVGFKNNSSIYFGCDC